MSQTPERTAVKASLLRKAAQNPALRERLRKAGLVPERTMTAAQRADLADVIRIARGTDESPEVLLGTKAAANLVVFTPAKKASVIGAAVERVDITKMPGFSPMQLRQHIDRVSEARREIDIISKRFADELKKIKALEKEEKAGIAMLEKAAKAMEDKGHFCVQAEKALINFTVYSQDKGPGIKQMIARPEDSKFGDKAGDLFGRIATKLGKEIAGSVEAMYHECEVDLTHAATCLRGLKVVSKTSSLKQASLKQAGIVDAVVGIKEWFAGQKNSLAARILNFAGTVKTWVKGFSERTKVVGKAEKSLEKALSSAKSQTDKILAGAL
jgi:hypothetical protein